MTKYDLVIATVVRQANINYQLRAAIASHSATVHIPLTRSSLSSTPHSLLLHSHRNMSTSPVEQNGVTSPSPSPASPAVASVSSLQRFPALLPASSHSPSSYPFGHISLPASIVFFSTPLSYASVNHSPILPGHVLIMPRSNTVRVKDLSVEELTDLWLTAQFVASVLERRIQQAEAITFAIQDGVEAGQKIPCVHVHIIPRMKKDLLKKDDIYDLIDKNVPASVLAVGSSTLPSHNVTVASQPAPPLPSSASSSPSPSPPSVRESLDDPKRVIRSRQAQAIEAAEFASWLKEAGIPSALKLKGEE